MRLVLLTYIGLCWILVATCSKKRNKTIWYTNIKLQHNPFYINEFTGRLTADRIALNLNLSIAKNLTEDLWVQLGCTKWESSTASYRSRLAYDINVYSLLRKGMDDKFNILYVWLNNFWKYGTLPMEVPFLQGLYYWRGLKPDKYSVPVFLLQGKYRMQIFTYFKPKYQSELRDGFMNLTFEFIIKAL